MKWSVADKTIPEKDGKKLAGVIGELQHPSKVYKQILITAI